MYKSCWFSEAFCIFKNSEISVYISECSTALQNIWDVRNKVYVNSYFQGMNSRVIWLFCVWGHGESKHHSRKDATKKNYSLRETSSKSHAH